MNQKTQPSTRDEWFAHMVQQEKSGLSGTGYCKKNDLIEGRFFYYRQLLRDTRGDLKKQPSFMPVIPTVTPIPASQSADIKIELPNGFHCYVLSQIDAAQLKKLIGVLLSC